MRSAIYHTQHPTRRLKKTANLDTQCYGARYLTKKRFVKDASDHGARYLDLTKIRFVKHTSDQQMLASSSVEELCRLEKFGLKSATPTAVVVARLLAVLYDMYDGV